ncbi:hypothetical protein V8E51_000345 [Hyaloscypha variabilis]
MPISPMHSISVLHQLHPCGPSGSSREDQLGSRRDDWDAQTTHEHLIPIAYSFSVVQNGWLGGEPGRMIRENHFTRGHPCKRAQTNTPGPRYEVEGHRFVAIPLFAPWQFCMKLNQAHR